MSFLGIPVMAIVGVIYTAVFISFLWILLHSRYTPTLGTLNHKGLSAIAITIGVFTVIWVVAWLRGRAMGFDLSESQNMYRLTRRFWSMGYCHATRVA